MEEQVKYIDSVSPEVPGASLRFTLEVFLIRRKGIEKLCRIRPCCLSKDLFDGYPVRIELSLPSDLQFPVDLRWEFG